MFQPPKLRLAGAALVIVAAPAIAQEAAAPSDAAQTSVHGACQTIVRSGVTASATCNFSYAGVETDEVPASKQLVIEHVSATCVGPLDGEIAFLSLQTQNAPGASLQPAFLLIAKRAPRLGLFAARYTASELVRLYAAAHTQVKVTLMLESEFPNNQPTPCDVRFQGSLLNVKGVQQ